MLTEEIHNKTSNPPVTILLIIKGIHTYRAHLFINLFIYLLIYNHNRFN